MGEGHTEATTTTTTVSSGTVTVNVGYPKSWQGVLKIIKIICLLACFIAAAILVSEANTWSRAPTSWEYCLAAAIIGFISELVIFILYLCGVNNKWSGTSPCAIVFLIYHALLTIMMYAACIVIAGGGYRHSMAYNAFGILALGGFVLEIYFNIIWIRGGPELAAFLQ